MVTLFGAWKLSIFYHFDNLCKSLRRRVHTFKRRLEVPEGGPRKRNRQSHADGAAGSRPVVEGACRDGFIYRAQGHFSRNRLTKESSSSSDSSSDDSSDDTSSNSGSSSRSSVDSDSDSTSSPSSDGPPRHLPRQLPRPPPPFQPPMEPRQPIPVPVPPGFGKPQTHARNERRRKKRLAERDGTTAPPGPAGSSNAIPLGTAKSAHTAEPTMMSLKNKNKRRGFKSSTGTPAARITFQDNESAPSAPSRPLPPSERSHLPPRLFVTSVDVEADKWRKGKEQSWDQERKNTQVDSYGQEESRAHVTLDYGGTAEEDSITASTIPDYKALENAWANAPPLVKTTTPSIGCIVGWQELGINPTTLTPEMMVFLARVVSGDEGGVVVVRIRPPGLGVVSFASGDLKDEEEEEKFPWDKILEMHWRLVSD